MILGFLVMVTMDYFKTESVEIDGERHDMTQPDELKRHIQDQIFEGKRRQDEALDWGFLTAPETNHRKQSATPNNTAPPVDDA